LVSLEVSGADVHHGVIGACGAVDNPIDRGVAVLVPVSTWVFLLSAFLLVEVTR
jgi:hypothetical protein